KAGERALFIELPCGSAMQDRALVPDQHIAHAPAVRIDRLGPGHSFHELFYQPCPFLLRQALDTGSMRPQEQRLCSIPRVAPGRPPARRGEFRVYRLLGQTRVHQATGMGKTVENNLIPRAFLRSSGRRAHPARVETNSVLPPEAGIVHPTRMFEMAGVGRKVLSVCQKKLDLMSRSRNSASSVSPPSVATVHTMGRVRAMPASASLRSSSGPNSSASARCAGSSRSWSRNKSSECRSNSSLISGYRR